MSASARSPANVVNLNDQVEVDGYLIYGRSRRIQTRRYLLEETNEEKLGTRFLLRTL
jgi:hypothetical protein